MTAAPTWTILIPTLGERTTLFWRLMATLLPQVERADGQVQVHGWFNNGRPSLPEIRQRLVLGATTDYVSFVDDDDLVSPDFVPSVFDALQTRPDYVGFQVQCYSDGAPTAIAYHSLKHSGWKNDPRGGRYLRDISHINPMRTRAARMADFRRTPVGHPEDRAWVGQLRRSRALKTEVVIDRIMYHYLYSTSRTPGEGSRWEKHRRPAAVGDRPRIDSPHFTWSDDV